MILKNAKIVLENKIIENGFIEIKDEKIINIGEGKITKEGIDLKNNVVMPGFIDCHVHGGYGKALEDGNNESLNYFAKKVAQEGITRYCQATVTQPVAVLDKLMSFYKKWMKEENKGPQARQIGMHLEGPFISKEKKGAHSLNLLKNPNVKIMKNWIEESGKNIKYITYAIELDKSGEFTKFLVKNNINPTIGHSNCSAETFENIGVKNGAKHITHIFNGMSTISHFTSGNGAPAGLAEGALINDEVLCEVISDGIHVNDETLKMIYKLKGADQICLITDAMNAKGLPDGNYKLGPLNVVKKGMKVKLKENNLLAGSGATFDHCFRHFKKVNNLDYLTMSKVSSINVAKELKIFDKTGSIAKNKLADLVVLDKNDNIKMTIVEGQIAFDTKF